MQYERRTEIKVPDTIVYSHNKKTRQMNLVNSRIEIKII